MASLGTSARGESVDFDILYIKQQLTSKPVVIGVNERRNFIDNKDGVKTINKTISTEPRNAMASINPNSELGDMMAASQTAVQESLTPEVSSNKKSVQSK